MTTRIAFLRAVNLGRRRVPMAGLRDWITDLGHDDVFTYVNSGNVVFDATGGRAPLERAIERKLADELGFDVETFVRSAAELRKVLAADPFPVAKADTYFVTFLREAPSAKAARDLEALTNDFDTIVVAGRDVHWRMHGKSTDSPLTARDWARIVGEHRSTSRNTTMLRKLVAKIDGR